MALIALAASVPLAFAPRQPIWLSLSHVLFVGVGALLAVVCEWSDVRPSRWVALAVAMGGAAIWGATAWGTRAGVAWWLLQPVNSVALVVATLGIGTWLAAELERPGHLLPVCVIGALADLWSVAAGPTRHIGEQTVSHTQAAAQHVGRGLAAPPPPWPSFLLYQWPLAGEGIMMPLVGFGDLVFLGLLAAAARRFGLPFARSFGLLVAGVACSLALTALLDRPVPALPAICGLFVLGNLGAMRLERREWLITVATAVALGGAVTFVALR